jgi:ATP-dependent Clp protease adaptor protein ClpS
MGDFVRQRIMRRRDASVGWGPHAAQIQLQRRSIRPSARLKEQAGVVVFSMRRRVREYTHSAATFVHDRPRAAVETPTIQQQEATKDEIQTPWNVVVHNDPVNLMSYVTMVFQRVFGYPRERAEKHMLEVHNNGRSILWSGLRERAELYVQQLHGYLLLATIEKTT